MLLLFSLDNKDKSCLLAFLALNEKTKVVAQPARKLANVHKMSENVLNSSSLSISLEDCFSMTGAKLEA